MQRLQHFKLRLYAQQFFGDCMPIYPLYALMFSQRTGLGTADISLLFLCWVIFAMIAEIPTGIIADKFSRKVALVSSHVLQALAFAVWLAFPSFLGYACGFFIWAIGYAFSSGTFQAYLYEELKAHDDAASFNKVFARSQSIKLVGMVAAYSLAWYLGASNFTLLLSLSIITSLITAGVTMSFSYKSKRKHDTAQDGSQTGFLKNAYFELRGSKKALTYMIALGILTSIVGVMEEYTPLFYSELGFSNDLVPVLLATGLILSSLVGWFAHRLERMRFTTVALFVVIAGSVMFIGTFSELAGFIAILVFMRLIMLVQTLFGASLQHVIQDRQRATIGSMASFAGQTLSIILLGVSSLLFAATSNMFTYRTLAIIFIALGVGLVVMGRIQKLKTDIPAKDELVITSSARTLE